MKNAAADREDVVVELREAQKVRLELLAAELAPIFADVPADAGFDFAISSGRSRGCGSTRSATSPWGATAAPTASSGTRGSAASCSPNRTTIKPVADQVTRYIAERIVERQRMIDGDVEPVLVLRARCGRGRCRQGRCQVQPPSRWRGFLSGLALVLAGRGRSGSSSTATLLWDKLAALGISF